MLAIARRRQKTRPPLEPDALAALVERSLDADRADDVRTIAMAGKVDYADFVVVASGTSARRVGAIAEHLIERLKAAGIKGVGVEGRKHNDWVLIDAGAVIVHVFRPEVRAFYDLEKLWLDEAAGPASEAG